MDSSQDQVGSDLWWANRLEKMLYDDTKRISELTNWYDGKPPINYQTEAQQKLFERFIKITRLNMAALVISTMNSRMKPIAFRTAGPDDDFGDEKAAAIMKRIGLKRQFTQALEWSSIYGRSSILVSTNKGKSWATAEHPSQTITERNPHTREVEAGLKIYRDLYGREVKVLYRPGYSITYLDGVGGARVKSGLDRCALIPFEAPQGKGEFERYVSSLERINYTIMQIMVIMTHQAFKQRGVKGVPLKDPETGKDIDYSEIFVSDPGAMWLLPPNSEVWESQQAELQGIQTQLKDFIKDLAIESSTPLYSITPESANGSAEGASLQRETHLAKIDDRLEIYEIPHCEVMSCLFQIEKDKERADLSSLEVIWKDPKEVSVMEMSQAAMNGSTAGLSKRLIMSKFMRMAPKEIKEEEDRQEEAERKAMRMQMREAASAQATGQVPGAPNNSAGGTNTAAPKQPLAGPSGA